MDRGAAGALTGPAPQAGGGAGCLSRGGGLQGSTSGHQKAGAEEASFINSSFIHSFIYNLQIWVASQFIIVIIIHKSTVYTLGCEGASENIERDSSLF